MVTMERDWGKFIKETREKYNWSQAKLAMKAGVSRSAIAMVESGRRKTPRGDNLIRIITALGISFDGLLSVGEHKESPEEILERFRLAQPVSVPVYGKFHFGSVHDEPLEYVYLARDKTVGKNIEAYRVEGHCMEPLIKNGDIVIVDRDRACKAGDVVICLDDNEFICGRLIMLKEDLCVMNSEEAHHLHDCQMYAVVIEVIKRI